MADDITTEDGKVLAAREVGGKLYSRNLLTTVNGTTATDVGSANPLPVAGPLTDDQLRANKINVHIESSDVASGGGGGGDATAANQVTGNNILTAINTKLGTSIAVTGTFWPATQPVSGTVGVSGAVAVTGTFWQTTQPISALSLPLPEGAATEATLLAVSAKLPTLGTKAASGSVSVAPSSDQDPKYSHADGVKVAVSSTSATVITPAAGVKYLHIMSTVDAFIRTDGAAAADAGGSRPIKAGVTETIPVVPSTAVTAYAASAGTIYATPMVTR